MISSRRACWNPSIRTSGFEGANGYGGGGRSAEHQRGFAEGFGALCECASGEKSGGCAGTLFECGSRFDPGNTEDLYSGLEHTVIPGVVESLKIITEKASTRVAKFRLISRKFGRKKIHAIHKANIMKLSDGLFLTSVRKVAENYPDIEYKELIVDNACMQMVWNPNQFDMLLLTNLYGDIMIDLAAGLIGGLGFAPSGNMGETIAVFEAVHGTAPDIAGKGLANPTALLMSAILMSRHIQEMAAAKKVEDALDRVYREGKHLTRDVGGTASTAEFTEAVIWAFA